LQNFQVKKQVISIHVTPALRHRAIVEAMQPYLDLLYTPVWKSSTLGTDVVRLEREMDSIYLPQRHAADHRRNGFASLDQETLKHSRSPRLAWNAVLPFLNIETMHYAQGGVLAGYQRAIPRKTKVCFAADRRETSSETWRCSCVQHVFAI